MSTLSERRKAMGTQLPSLNDNAPQTPTPSRPAGTSIAEEIRLLGQPSLQDYLTFVRHYVVDGKLFDASVIADLWRQANDRYSVLEENEAGAADEIEVFGPDSLLEPLIAETKRDPRYSFTFDTFPTEIVMVELDRLVIYQKHLTRSYTDQLIERLQQPENPLALYRFCQPPAGSSAAVDMHEIGRRRYVFSSLSTDLRRHEPVLLQPEQVSGYQTFGPVSAYVSIPVGFGSNFFTGIACGDRVLLHNGYHRAYAMRARGITHAPCIVQRVTRRDEIEVAAKEEVADDAAFYFASARPPLLKDFFDPELTKIFKVFQTKKLIEVTFEVRDFDVWA